MTDDLDNMTREEALIQGAQSLREAAELVAEVADLFRENMDRLRAQGKDDITIAAVLASEFFKDDDGEPWDHHMLLGTLCSAILKIINLQDNIAVLTDAQHRGRE